MASVPVPPVEHILHYTDKQEIPPKRCRGGFEAFFPLSPFYGDARHPVRKMWNFTVGMQALYDDQACAVPRSSSVSFHLVGVSDATSEKTGTFIGKFFPIIIGHLDGKILQ